MQYCTLEPVSRKLILTEPQRIAGVESDENVRGLKFKFPKIVEGTDFTQMQLRINFINSRQKKGQYIVTDLKPLDGEEDYITFTWQFSRLVTKYRGITKFVICAVKTDEGGTITAEWNTALTQLRVLEGLEVDEPEINPEEKDVIAQLISICQNSANEAAQSAQQAQEEAEKVLDIIPVGGTKGQVLTKLSDEDKDYNWQDLEIKPIFSVPISVNSQTDFKSLYLNYNRLNPLTVSIGRYVIDTTGIEGINASYDASDYIEILPEEELYVLNANLTLAAVRTACFYDGDKKYIAGISSGIKSIKNTYAAKYVRISIRTGTASSTMVVNNRNINRFYDFGNENEKFRGDYIDASSIENLSQAISLAGLEAYRHKQDSLTSNTILIVNDFPQSLKKNQTMTFKAKFDSFTNLIIGYGKTVYGGCWLEIDTSNVYWKDANGTKATALHGLTISKYISVVMNFTADAELQYAVNTLSGTYTGVFKWSNDRNGKPFVLCGGHMTDIHIGLSSADFSKPIWAFGDSYFGFAAGRVMGQLKVLGGTDGILVNGLSGRVSSAAYADLISSLRYGMPKYILWCMGMNDNLNDYRAYFDKVKLVCNSNNIEMIPAIIPTVPDRDKEEFKKYAESSGLRLINWYEAVGINASGEWYNGFLSADRVHPTQSGAKALAVQMLIDVPEILQ